MASEIIEIIEDDPGHAALLDRALRKARYRTNVAHDGKSGFDDVKRLHPALVILDVMLPIQDGHEVCRRLRQDDDFRTIPILMLSALGAAEDHRVAGLDLGADDYMAKPFSTREVVARVEALLRRARSMPTAWRFGCLTGTPAAEGRPDRLQLSWPQWQILRRLSCPAGQMVLREELIARVWGNDGLIHDHQLEREIHALNQRLSPHPGINLILSVPGGGYLLMPPVSPSAKASTGDT